MLDDGGEPLILLAPGCVAMMAAWCLLSSAQSRGIVVRVDADGEIEVHSPVQLHPDVREAFALASWDMRQILGAESAARVH